MLKILLAEDEIIMREGLRFLFNQFEQFDVVGEANDGSEVIQLVHNIQPDIVIMDHYMQPMTGLAATSVLAEEAPDVAVIMLSGYKSLDLAETCIRAGAKGYILKQNTTKQVVGAIETIQRGEIYLDATLQAQQRCAKSSKQKGVLTQREREVVDFYADGITREAIAERLGIAVKTVDSHLNSSMTKLQLNNRVELVLWVLKQRDSKPPTYY